MNRCIKRFDGTIILDELPSTCIKCILEQNKEYVHLTCDKYGDSRRLGYIRNNQGEVFACSNDSKTTKNFKTELTNSLLLLPYSAQLCRNIEKSIAQKEEKRYQELVHNIKNINKHCIQELYDIFPNGELNDAREAIKYTRNIIEKDF